METNNFFPAPSQKEKELAALSYLWIFSVLIYFSPKGKSKFVQYHAKQGIFLFILSTTIYFLPHFLSWINFITLFMMVLGIIESLLGHWYNIPVIGEMVQGNFHPQKYVNYLVDLFLKIKNHLPQKQIPVFSNFLLKIKKYFPSSQSASVSVFKTVTNSPKPYLFKNDTVNKIAPLKLKNSFKLNLVKDWHKEIITLEIECLKLLKTKNMIIHHFDGGFIALIDDQEHFYFGKVKDDNFAIAYCNEQEIFPGDETIGNWEIKNYDLHNFNQTSFTALINLIIE